MGSLAIVILAAATMVLLAVAMAWILGWANRAFHVEVDPRVDAINSILPAANCGACGCVGCGEFAEGVVAGTAQADGCPVGGSSVAQGVAKIMGLDLAPSWPYRPIVHCRAPTVERLHQVEYRGEPTCSAANLVSGTQGCTYGCLGLSDCVVVCDYDAIHIVDGLAVVDYDKCVGCKLCAAACPRNIITMVPFKQERMLTVACSNKDVAKDVKSVCKVGCIGCSGCAKRSGLFIFEDGLARVDYEKYDPETLEAADVAIDKCPAQGIVMVGKPTDKDKAQLENEDVPALVEADFKTTVDQTEWQG